MKPVRRSRLPLALLPLAVMLALLPALAMGAPLTRKAQKPKTEEPKKVRPAPPTPEAAQGPLSELSETMGALAVLSQLCAPDITPNPWRMRMEALVEAEGEASGAKERMQGAFNRGYADFSTSYTRCTPAAKAADEALRREAARLARVLTQRFGT